VRRASKSLVAMHADKGDAPQSAVGVVAAVHIAGVEVAVQVKAAPLRGTAAGVRGVLGLEGGPHASRRAPPRGQL